MKIIGRNCMELQKFTEKMVKALTEYYGAEAEIKIHKVNKNNGIRLQGICVLKKGKNIAPTVYLESFLERYLNGEIFGELVKEMITFIEKNQLMQDFDMNFFVNYENVKKKLVLRLIHKEKNRDLLSLVPYMEFQDLAIVCHCILMTEEIGTGTILIYKEHLKMWQIEEETLFKDAFENSPKTEPFEILKMSEMVRSILERSIKERIEEICGDYFCDKDLLLNSTLDNITSELEGKQIPMYVITNEKRYYGAACMVYPNMLEKIAEKLQDDFYIIPSSIHEIIVVAKNQGIDSFGLNEMIREVNMAQVEEEEWLSDHTYLYQRKNHKLISVTNH